MKKCENGGTNTAQGPACERFERISLLSGQQENGRNDLGIYFADQLSARRAYNLRLVLPTADLLRPIGPRCSIAAIRRRPGSTC